MGRDATTGGHNAAAELNFRAGYADALEQVQEVITNRAAHHGKSVPAHLLPKIALDKVFDTTTIEIPFATVESAAFYRRSADHFFQQVNRAVTRLGDGNPAPLHMAGDADAAYDNGYKAALADVAGELRALDPEAALLPMSRRFDEKLEEIRADMTKGDGKRNLSSLSENVSLRKMEEQVLDGQWRFIHAIHTDLGEHVARLQKGYSAADVLKGKGRSRIKQLTAALFAKTPPRPAVAARPGPRL